MEKWKDVKGYEGMYQISDRGRVKSLKWGKETILKERLTFDGYVKASFRKGDVAKDFRVHRLVALNFIPNPDNKETVNHRDGNKTNNHYSNLEWATRKEQVQHSYDLGLKKPMRGSENYASKLTDDDVRYIRKHYKKRCREFGTVALGKKFGVDDSIIGKVVRGISYKHVE